MVTSLNFPAPQPDDDPQPAGLDQMRAVDTTQATKRCRGAAIQIDQDDDDENLQDDDDDHQDGDSSSNGTDDAEHDHFKPRQHAPGVGTSTFSAITQFPPEDARQEKRQNVLHSMAQCQTSAPVTTAPATTVRGQKTVPLPEG